MICYTIGHSNVSSDEFIRLLKSFAIRRVVDVRSAPYSRYAAQFNREAIASALQAAGIDYEYRGDRLGGKQSDPALMFPDGKVNFSLVRMQQKFVKAAAELIDSCRSREATCLMCAEKEPFDCHRFVLIGRHLSEEGVRVEHIRSDGSVVEQRQLENELLKRYEQKNYQYSLFEQPPDRGQQLARAYELRNREIAPAKTAVPDTDREVI